MSKRRNFIKESGKDISVKKNRNVSALSQVIIMLSILISNFSCTQTAITTGFDPSRLNQSG